MSGGRSVGLTLQTLSEGCQWRMLLANISRSEPVVSFNVTTKIRAENRPSRDPTFFEAAAAVDPSLFEVAATVDPSFFEVVAAIDPSLFEVAAAVDPSLFEVATAFPVMVSTVGFWAEPRPTWLPFQKDIIC